MREQVTVELMGQVIRKILPAVVPTTETVEVQMAKGKLEEASKLGQSGLWTRMLETLEAMEPLKKPQDEAYRSYNLGVAYEALAYQDEHPDVVRKLLDQAAVAYGKAIDLKPDEKYFRQPQLRIQTAILQFGKSLSQREQYALAGEGPSRTNAPVGSRAPASFNNQHVIALTTSGLDETILVDMIRQAKTVQFDLSVEATLVLLQNKVANTVIAAMRARGAQK